MNNALFHSDREITDFIRHLVSNRHPHAERRESERTAICMVAPATPINGTYEKAGETCEVVTRDVSARGISLLSPTEVREKWLTIDMEGPDHSKMQLLIEVVRCRRLTSWCFEVAGTFARWSN